MVGFASVAATAAERRAPAPGDDVLPEADVVMDRAFTVPGSPDDVWPWLVQLGKGRAGWYLPRRVERFVPPSHRAAREVDERWQHLEPGQVVPDYGGTEATFTVVEVRPAEHLVYGSTRGRTPVRLTWAITVQPAYAETRVRLRLRLHPVRRRWLALSLGEWFDALTVAGMAAGLRERLLEARRP